MVFRGTSAVLPRFFRGAVGIAFCVPVENYNINPFLNLMEGGFINPHIFLRHFHQRRRSCKSKLNGAMAGTTSNEACRPTAKHKNCTDMAERHASNKERHEGTSQLEHTPHSYRSNKKLKLRTMGTDARSFNSMPAKAAAMLFLKKGSQLKVNRVSLCKRQDRAA